MNARRTGLAVVALGFAALVTGCMPKMTIEDLKAMKPQRPAELDKLNVFTGKWQATGEAKLSGLDQVLKSSGTSQGQWEGDGWYLVNHNTVHMDELGDMSAIETWTYDVHSDKYRSTWVDSMGSVGTGVAWLDDDTNTWHVKATSHGPMGKSTMKGKARVVDDNTIEWEWAEYTFFGLFKTMEMKGTSRKQ